MKRILIAITLLVVFLPSMVFAQDPGTNIGTSLSVMRQKFPELRYVKTDEKGMMYEDGYPQDGIATFFYFRNDKVVEECMIVQSNDGFPRMWYDKMVDSFISNYSSVCAVNGYNVHRFCYSSFKVHLIYVSENGSNTAMIIYEEGGCGYFSGMTPKEFFEKYNSK